MTLPLRSPMSLCATLSLVLSLLAGSASAQEKNQVLYPVSSELARRYKRANELVSRGEIDQALDLYAEIVKQDENPRESDRVIELEDKGRKDGTSSKRSVGRRRFKPRRFIGITAAVRARLRALPAEARARYRATRDYQAKAALEDLLETRPDDREALRRFYDQHELTSWGAPALERLGDIAFERGSLEVAKRHYQALLERHSGELKGAATGAIESRLVACLAGLGDSDALRKLAAQLGLDGADAKLTFGEQALTMPKLLELCFARRGALEKRANTTLDHIRSNPQHTASHALPLNIGDKRFDSVRFTSNNRESYPNRSVPSPFSRFQSGETRRAHNTSLPVVIQRPRRRGAAAEPLALLNTGSNLKTFWLRDGRPGPRVRMPSQQRFAENNAKILHGGAVSHDIFVSSCIERVNKGGNYRGIPIKIDLPVRKLYGVNTRNWRLIWDHRQTLRGTRFARASFPAAPVIVDDTIFASAVLLEGFVQSYVMAFDLWTGRMKWATWICSGQVEQTMFGEHAREPLMTSIAVEQGTVFHCSALGAMAALDARDGKPRWMSSYEQVEIAPPKGYYPVERTLGWANTAPAISDGVVVAAPLDSDFAMGYDIETGKTLWRYPRRNYSNRNELEHILGCADGRVVFSGSRRLECRQLRSGRLLWALPQNELLGQRLAGRGLLAQGRVCVLLLSQGRSSSSAAVVQFGLKAGTRLLSEDCAATRRGDLSLSGGNVIITGGGVLHVFENRRRKRQRDF